MSEGAAGEGKPMVLVLVGPTASGKTAVSLPLAEQIGAEIISADSRQLYRYMDIGTAKPTSEDRERIPHHFIDIRNPDEDYSAGEFGASAGAEIDRILSRGRLPLIVGGSGLYVRSLIDGFFDGPPADREYRAELERRVGVGGVGGLLDDLRRLDPEYAAVVDPTKPRRIIRALEVVHITGRPLSVLHRERKPEIRFEARQFGLSWRRPELYDRINRRCRTMLEAGLLDEVDRLVSMGYGPGLNALNTVGYAEAFACRRGEITPDEMDVRFAQNSRRYAKRQVTWFARDQRIRWIQMDENRDPYQVAEEIACLWDV
jgi:tRNA dimethylallyltransferase